MTNTAAKTTTLMLTKGDLDRLLAALNDRESVMSKAFELAGGPATKKFYGEELASVRDLAETLIYARAQIAA